MSSTTRAGFLIPAVTDFADEIAYYDNNITQFEAEIGTPIQVSLPASGNFEGRAKAVNYSGPAGYAAPGILADDYIRATVSPNAQNWIPVGAATQLRFIEETTFANAGAGGTINNSTVTANGAGEVFQSLSDPFLFQINSAQVNNAQALFKFCCQVALDFSGAAAASMSKFIGKYNIFINPVPQDVSGGSAVQPTPTTPGVIRLSFPIEFGADSVITHNANGQHVVYGELFWSMPTAPQPSWPASWAFGVAAYLSATDTNNQPVGTKYPASGAGPSSCSIQTEIYSVF